MKILLSKASHHLVFPTQNTHVCPSRASYFVWLLLHNSFSRFSTSNQAAVESFAILEKILHSTWFRSNFSYSLIVKQRIVLEFLLKFI